MKKVNLQSLPQQGVSHNPKVTKQMMIGFGELSPLVQFSRAVFPAGESAPAHKHEDMAEVFLVESGEGLIRIDDEEHTMQQGDCITVEKNEMHEIYNNGSKDLVLIFFGVTQEQ